MAANGTTSAWSPGTDPVGAPKFVDFRSDTTTYPTTEMFAAMSAASLGDDVFADDPSTAALEARVADLFGKEAGLLVLTGTMGNQIAVAAHLSASAPPHSIVLDSRSHIYKWEAGGVSYHTGAAVIPVPVPDGSWLTPDFIKSCWWSPASQDSHHAPCRLICVENTLDGAVFPIQKLRDLKQFAEESKVPVHMDGARLWNAAASGQATLREYADCADSISLCFSKGLGTPMGTVVVGSKTLIDRARKFRKIFGGGWRQSGILAAACDHALTHHLPDLHRDHDAALSLSHSLSDLGFKITKPVDTNMVWVDVAGLGITEAQMEELKNSLLDKGIKIGAGRGTAFRIVVHRQNNGKVGMLVDAFREYLERVRGK